MTFAMGGVPHAGPQQSMKLIKGFYFYFILFILFILFYLFYINKRFIYLGFIYLFIYFILAKNTVKLEFHRNNAYN